MLRSIQVVKSCSRDHVILVITSSRLANGTHFNADRQFRQTWRHINSSSPVVITSSRAQDMNGTLFHRSWTREHEFTTWKERSKSNKQLETAASNIIPTNRVRAVPGAIIRL